MELALKLHLGHGHKRRSVQFEDSHLVSQQEKLEDYGEILTAKLNLQANTGVERSS